MEDAKAQVKEEELKSIPTELKELEIWVTRLSNDMDKLHAKVQPILNHGATSACSSAVEEEEPACEIAHSIRGNRMVVTALRNNLSDIISKIEL